MNGRKAEAAEFGRSTSAVLLAAGSGERFGGRKLLAPFFGQPLVQRAIDAACASRALSCILVLGADADAIMDCTDTRRCAIVRNENWQEGIAASIQTGLRFTAESDACVFMLADQPFVSSADIDALLQCSADLRSADLYGRPQCGADLYGRRQCGADLYGRPPIVALRSGKTWGAPVLFPRRDFAALTRLRGDVGAKRYAETQRNRLRFVTARDPRAFRDVDSSSDLRALQALRIG
jgi:molybdenum cofactor cytidylyltransferase